MNIDERIEAMSVNLEVMSGMLRDVIKRINDLTQNMDELRKNSMRDGESIRALARVAEIHERRLTDLEQPG